MKDPQSLPVDDATAIAIRGAFSSMRDSEVRFGIGLLDDFSCRWGELDDGLKQKWREVASKVSK